jgi:hypothetical protein
MSKVRSMKQIISWLLVIVFTFMLGVAVALLYLESTVSVTQKSEISSSLLNKEINDENVSMWNAGNLPILSYCELANNPEKYDGKIVRLSATLYQNMHGLKFLDAICYSEEKETAVLFDDKRETEIVAKIAQEIQTERFIYWGSRRWL